MSILSDIQVRELVDEKKIIIDPYFKVFQGSNCYHCHLGNRFKKIKREYIRKKKIINPLYDCLKDVYEDFEVSDFYVIKPGEFVLAELFEYLGTCPKYVLKLLNSSSLARVGIFQAALGMVNAGCGMKKPIKLTLELINNSPVPIKLIPTRLIGKRKVMWGTEVLKIVVIRMDRKPEVPYDNWKRAVYSGDQKVVGSKMAGRFPRWSLLKSPNSLHLREIK